MEIVAELLLWPSLLLLLLAEIAPGLVHLPTQPPASLPRFARVMAVPSSSVTALALLPGPLLSVEGGAALELLFLVTRLLLAKAERDIPSLLLFLGMLTLQKKRTKKILN
jgi:hypothetical protein